ncbi:hypothetical protein NV391_09680 [Companilactobacillus crustorum]|nr:hypothetical protein [Companilactobacillus crustorum]WDT65226.1 hypothetical protein NV391_09680 [Companilactobacillus crustorum]
MDNSTRELIMGFVAFVIVFVLSILKVSQTMIGGVLVVGIFLSALILKRF